MPKNVLFLLKNCKNRLTLGGSAPRPLCLRRMGLRSQTSTSVILHCKVFSLQLPTRPHSFGIAQKALYVLVIIIAGVHQAFGVERLCCISYGKDYGNFNYRFQFFSFCLPHSFCADVSPDQQSLLHITRAVYRL